MSIAELLKASPVIPEDDTEYEKFTPYYKADDFTPPTQTTENTFAINPSSYLYVSAEGNDLVFKWWNGNSDEADDEGAERQDHQLGNGAQAHSSGERRVLDVHLGRAGRAGGNSVLSQSSVLEELT